MRIICTTNNLGSLDDKLMRFAFMQDVNGIVPLTVGSTYEVYGIKNEATFGSFLLIVRDGEELPWWMPRGFFDTNILDDQLTNSSWHTEEYESSYGGVATVTAPKLFLDNEDDIEDGTDKGKQVFMELIDEQKQT